MRLTLLLLISTLAFGQKETINLDSISFDQETSAIFNLKIPDPCEHKIHVGWRFIWDEVIYEGGSMASTTEIYDEKMVRRGCVDYRSIRWDQTYKQLYNDPGIHEDPMKYDIARIFYWDINPEIERAEKIEISICECVNW